MNEIALPWSMQFELTWGCNKRCWFCGIHDIPFGEYRHMPLELATEAARQIGEWKPKMRMEFGTGGEPPLNPHFFEIINTLRMQVPKIQIMVQTNGEVWQPDATNWIHEFFARGANILVINCYKRGLREFYTDLLAGAQDVDVVDFYYNNPLRKSMYHYEDARLRRIFICEDLGLMTTQGVVKEKKVTQRNFNNQGGSTPDHAMTRAGLQPLTSPLHKKCSRPFREMVISYDGHVPLCCYDWLDRLTLGQFPQQSLTEIWNGRRAQVVRQLVYNKQRGFMPCETCSYNGGFRLGFLKNPGLDESDEDLLGEVRGYQQVEAAGYQPYQQKAMRRWQPDAALPVLQGATDGV